MIFSSSRLSVSLLFASSLALSGCIVDIDAGGTGGTGGQGGSGAQGGGGQSGCDDHDDCPGSEVCVYDTGECRAPCFDDSQCGAGEVCNECVTSSCPSCEDCRGACEPAQTAGCDEHADCGDDGVCLYATGECRTACSDDAQCGAGEACNECATSSCPACEDCVGACEPAQTAGCDEHADCPDGLCVFSTGQCAEGCGGPEGCSAPGEVCDGCATASCPDCDDCLGACVPGNGQCDTGDDCGAGESCDWTTSLCQQTCSPGADTCEPGYACAECATSSCPACADCIDICLPLP